MSREAQGLIGSYVDADFDGDVDTRRSMTGFIFSLYGGPISWRSSLQPITALSTTEVKYIKLTEAAKEVIWQKGLLMEMGLTQEAIRVHCDS